MAANTPVPCFWLPPSLPHCSPPIRRAEVANNDGNGSDYITQFQLGGSPAPRDSPSLHGADPMFRRRGYEKTFPYEPHCAASAATTRPSSDPAPFAGLLAVPPTHLSGTIRCSEAIALTAAFDSYPGGKVAPASVVLGASARLSLSWIHIMYTHVPFKQIYYLGISAVPTALQPYNLAQIARYKPDFLFPGCPMQTTALTTLERIPGLNEPRPYTIHYSDKAIEAASFPSPPRSGDVFWSSADGHGAARVCTEAEGPVEQTPTWEKVIFKEVLSLRDLPVHPNVHSVHLVPTERGPMWMLEAQAREYEGKRHAMPIFELRLLASERWPPAFADAALKFQRGRETLHWRALRKTTYYDEQELGDDVTLLLAMSDAHSAFSKARGADRDAEPPAVELIRPVEGWIIVVHDSPTEEARLSPTFGEQIFLLGPDRVVSDQGEILLSMLEEGSSSARQVAFNVLQPNVPDFVLAVSDCLRAEETTFTAGYWGDQQTTLGPRHTTADDAKGRTQHKATHRGFLQCASHDHPEYCQATTVVVGGVMSSARKRSAQSDGPAVDGVVELHPGDVIFYPPGSNPAAYFAVNSITQHHTFLTYGTLHLTEQAVFETKRPRPSLLAHLTRMALALRYDITDKLYRHPALALCVMILRPDNYKLKEHFAGQTHPHVEEMSNQLNAAQDVASHLIRLCKVDVKGAEGELRKLAGRTELGGPITLERLHDALVARARPTRASAPGGRRAGGSSGKGASAPQSSSSRRTRKGGQ
ncbi:hypothetical protein BV25DRAFT_1839028 [Artomyces pyxidatus]|uniref:Uncharacterized protein n=1 Tax=Artomyces pyxidatus TaxID=48021 RepID=A0ACB8T0C4_9AGAM|nr:hypothetical protein BV25DRAFT_1839028 [Artomyces pyxidatus]